MSRKRWAVLGAGNGGQAFAAYLALQGLDITIFDVFSETAARLNEQGGIYIEGRSKVTGFGRILFASCDIEKTIEGAEVILIVLPSMYHKSIAEQIAPFLKSGQIVIGNPITPMGSMEFSNALKAAGCQADIVLAGTDTLLFACRLQEPGRVLVSGQKHDITMAAYPATGNDALAQAVRDVLPEYRLVPDLLQVTFDNLNFEFHPGPTLLYTAMIEHETLQFEYYHDFVPSQIRLIMAIDQERLALCERYGVEARDVATTFRDEYGYEGDLYQMVKHADCYNGIMGPKTMNNRFLMEDIPYSLRAIQSLAQIAHIATPAIDTVVNLAYILLGEQLDEGRTLQSLGLSAHTTVEDVIRMCRG
ncbi:MAG: hypothetical protein HFF40_01935 [Lawsonibacter sp.]|jgi:opine dehydrogenase|uniref:NAD/NADP-dependent octopine/nopaline dehydrogenase family protein n=1 Tax=Lawsonibacter sp. JLR.KK007 TaxID=3114293 RepID=UPI002170526F|nr:hypothetical protein [Lawsonibacter sp.]